MYSVADTKKGYTMALYMDLWACNMYLNSMHYSFIAFKYTLSRKKGRKKEGNVGTSEAYIHKNFNFDV
jgi:hypothetical protein